MEQEKNLVEEQHRTAGIGCHEVKRHAGDRHRSQDLGLGLFLHWSICSVTETNISWSMIPGGVLADTNAITDPIELETLVQEKDFDRNGTPWTPTPNAYWAWARDFNPSSYCPEKWCMAARKAGFNYVVLTARHHDGFALWPSAYGTFSTRNYMGGRDLIKPYVEACRETGLKVGLYYSPPDWYHFRDVRNFLIGNAQGKYPDLSLDADLNPRKAPVDKTKEQELRAQHSINVRGQITELLSHYGPIDFLWFDGNLPKGGITIDEIRALQPDIRLNNRGGQGGDFSTYERHFPETRPPQGVDAEFCDTWNGRWPHTPHPFRAPAWATGQLAQCRAWDMNFLLGIGPMANGELSPSAYANIATLGEWINIHRESVLDGARALPAGEQANVTATAAGNTRYLFALHTFSAPCQTGFAQQENSSNFGKLPENQNTPQDLPMTLSGIPQPVSVVLMRTREALAHTYSAARRTLELILPASLRYDNTDVIKVILDDF
jgi:alpha-L-fucosidase